ncbi:MAG: DUF1905 domain-containing protein [Bacteroidota bacterium]
MSVFQFEQTVRQLEKRKGGYYYFQIPAETVAQLPNQRKTRLLCTVEEQLTYSCGLNHLGNGDFFLILSTKNLQKVGKALGDPIRFRIEPDPNPLGVKIPESLEVLLEQDEDARSIFEKITDGKKRSLIHTINRIKDIDKQIQTSLKFLAEQKMKLRN